MTSHGNGKLLSVVTVCYQDRANVEKTCASILAQAGSHDIEHILVDGGSSDGTQEWYAANGPVATSTLISERDRGIFHAMNKGLETAQGEYVCFLNAGDVWADTRYVDRLMTALDVQKPSWFYSRARVVDAEGREVRSTVGMVPYSRRRHALGLATICHQAVVMRKDFLRALNGFDESFSYAADYHLLLKAGAVSKPLTSASTDVLYAAGGVSDTDVYRQLWRRHAARVDALALNSVLTFLDAGWTAGQVCVVRIRKIGKRVLRRFGIVRFFGRAVG